MIYFMEIPMKMDDLEVLLPRNLTAGSPEVMMVSKFGNLQKLPGTSDFR